jgi:hypothetical protein
LNTLRASHERFVDRCTGVIPVGNTAVHFAVRDIGHRTFRVLFTQLDAAELAVDLQAQYDGLAARVAALEKATAVQRPTEERTMTT